MFKFKIFSLILLLVCSVASASRFANSIISVDGPNEVEAGTTVTLRVSFATDAGNGIRVDLEDNNNGGAVVAGSTAIVPEGISNLDIDVAVDSSVAAHQNYEWNIYITENGGDTQIGSGFGILNVSVIEGTSIAGLKRLNDQWKGWALTVYNQNPWDSVTSATQVDSWWSQQWEVIEAEAPANAYIIRNRWSGHVLTSWSEYAWQTLVVAPLNEDWWSQRWVLESTGNDGEYRLRNAWNGFYIHQTGVEWNPLIQAPLNESWNSQKWALSDVD